MSNPYASFCEDFYVGMRLSSQMPLPDNRETVLHFFEQIQKGFPAMGRFCRADGELTLEEDRKAPEHRWLTLENKRLSSGHVNPQSIEEASRLHRTVLQMAPHTLGISPIEIDSLDVMFGFDIEFSGNHHEIIAETMYRDSPVACLLEEAGVRALDAQPTMAVALSEDCGLQARIDILPRTSSYQIRTGEYPDDCISIHLILSRFWADRPRSPLEDLFTQMARQGDALCTDYVLPRIVRPISEAIASRS